MKIAVAMSGGVDSSLAAAMLVEAGHDVVGVYLDCWEEPGCKVDENRKDAMRVGLKLKIPMKVLNFKKEYRKRVMDWFFEEVKKGRTPNPDVLCNKEIKFGILLDWAIENGPASTREGKSTRGGFDKLATGHYARIKDKRLLMGVDKKKDQSYFLSLLKQERLKRVMFPIGAMTKDKVRKEAKEREIHVWNKKGTSGICFIGHTISFEDFLKTRIKEHRGEVVDVDGKVIGEHKGIEFYTIGQRHGFEVRQTSAESKPLFVVKKDKDKNQLVVGEKKELLRDSFEVEGWSLIGKDSLKGKGLKMRIRHGGKLVDCEVKGNRVSLKEKVFGVAPGQVAVIYLPLEVNRDYMCLGGGVIKG